MSKLELLSGPQVEEALRGPDVRVFRYVLNRPGLYFLLAIAFAFYGLAGLAWWETQLSEPHWTVLFVALLGVGVVLSGLAAYWHQFATQNVLGISPETLLIGGPSRLWSISWDLLDKRSMGFGAMELTRLRGSLTLDVGGQSIKLHLFNAIAYLSDIEGFMLGVLTRLQPAESDVDEEE